MAMALPAGGLLSISMELAFDYSGDIGQLSMAGRGPHIASGYDGSACVYFGRRGGKKKKKGGPPPTEICLCKISADELRVLMPH